MTDVATLLSAYVDALQSGAQPDVRDYLDRAESGAERRELAAAIEGVLTFAGADARHPRDPATGEFVVPGQEARVADIVDEALDDEPGGWPELLPVWRERAGLSAGELARRVVRDAHIGAGAENVAAARRWVERMESGAIGSRDVSPRAIESIAFALGVESGVLERAGRRPAPAGVIFRPASAGGTGSPAPGAQEAIGEIAAGLADALDERGVPPAAAGTEADAWFASGGC